MRTTVTLDDDVVRELRERVKQGDRSFKKELNDALRLAFSISRAPSGRRRKFKVKAHRSRFRHGIDPEKLNQLVDQLDVEERVSPRQRKR